MEFKDNTTEIIYFGQKVKVKCDQKCNKAWGPDRPTAMLPNSYISDDNLGDAPIDPGTYEGGQGKPLSSDQFPNKWCVRACERCNFITE